MISVQTGCAQKVSTGDPPSPRPPVTLDAHNQRSHNLRHWRLTVVEYLRLWLVIRALIIAVILTPFCRKTEPPVRWRCVIKMSFSLAVKVSRMVLFVFLRRKEACQAASPWEYLEGQLKLDGL